MGTLELSCGRNALPYLERIQSNQIHTFLKMSFAGRHFITVGGYFLSLSGDFLVVVQRRQTEMLWFCFNNSCTFLGQVLTSRNGPFLPLSPPLSVPLATPIVSSHEYLFIILFIDSQ